MVEILNSIHSKNKEKSSDGVLEYFELSATANCEIYMEMTDFFK